MTSKMKRRISTLLLFLMVFTIVVPAQSFAQYSPLVKEETTQKKFQIAVPSMFNPDIGQTTTILWNYQLDQETTITIYPSDDVERKNPIRTLVKNKMYEGDYKAHSEEWNGKDGSGQVVSTGAYIVRIQPLNEKWAMYYEEVTVIVTNNIAADIAIAPNIGADKFIVYGSAEENTTEVEVILDKGNPQNANVDGGIWQLEVELEEAYKIYNITAVKTNIVPVEKVNEEGQAVVVEQEEKINLGPINVLKFVVRAYDSFPEMAAKYYGDENEFSRIIETNHLSEPYMIEIGNRLLILDPNEEGTPELSKYVDESIAQTCGIVDLMKGRTYFSDDPVNLATGTFVYSYEDIRLDGSFPISFSRFYNSRDQYNGVLGMNWHHNYEYRLQDMGDGTVEIIFDDGRREIYIQIGGGDYESPVGVERKLRKNGNRSYTLIEPDQWEYQFNPRGELVSIKDNNGNETELVYEGFLLREIRNDSGYIHLQYNNAGKIRKISDSTGRFVEYQYNSKNQMMNYKNPEGHSIEYQYDSDHRITKIVDPLGTGSITNIYDDKDRVVEQILANGSRMYFEYDEANQRTILTERDGSQIVYYYDDLYRITDVIYEDGMTKATFNDKNQRSSFTDKNGNTTYFEYDDRGNMTLVKDPMGYVTRYTYDENNRVTSVEMPDGAVHRFTYDQKGNMLSSSDPTHNMIQYLYNSKGLPEKVIQPNGSSMELRYDSRGNIIEIIDPELKITKFEYDELNRVKTTTDPEGNKTTYEYTNKGKIGRVTDAEGNYSNFYYNSNSKLERMIDQEGNITRYLYDASDYLIEVIDPLQGSTRMEYNEMGNMVRAIDANGGITNLEYDSQGRVISITDSEGYTSYLEYDKNGNVIKSTDPRGYSSRFEYDILNRLTQTIDANQYATKYEYDEVGRIRRVINAVNDITEYDYDAAGRLISIKDVMGNETIFTYNKLALVEKVIDAEGSVTRYEYDFVGNLIKLTDAEDNITQWQYDGNGNVTKVMDPLGNETTYTYNRINQVKTMTNAKGHRVSFEYNRKGNITAVIDENGNRTQYKYDALENLIEVIDAKGHSTRYKYDAIGNLIEVHQYRGIAEDTIGSFIRAEGMDITPQTVTQAVYQENQQYLHESIKILNSEYKEEIVAGKVYSKDQSVIDSVYGEFKVLDFFDPGMINQVTKYEYDRRGLVTKVTDVLGKVTVYDYDANGNLISVTDRDGYVTDYKYDSTNLLKKVTFADWKSIEYQHDPLGRITEMKDWLGRTNIDLDPLGRILKVNDFENRVMEYTWTPTGQKQSMLYPDGSVVHYSYDKLGRMTNVTDTLGETTQYSYDSVGNLKERILPNGSKTEYQYDALYQITELKEFDPARKIIDRYVYSYDRAGNKISINKMKSDLDDDALDGEEREDKYYNYDALNQLIGLTENNRHSAKYFYDTLGNRIRLEKWVDGEVKEAINYEYNLGNRLVSTYDDYMFIGNSEDYEAYITQNAEALSKENFKSYRYDNRGNLIEVKSDGKIFNKYKFDPRNQLTEVTNKHGDKTKYTYDGFGNRVQTIVDLNHPGGINRPEPPSNGNNGNGNAYGHDNGNNGNAYGHENGNNGNAYGHDKEHPGQGNAYGRDKNGNPKPGWDHQYKRRDMELNYVVDITSAYNDVLMIYGDHYQVQRYTHGIDRISMDFWMLEDHDNGWIPNGSQMNLSGDRERLYYLHDELGSVTKVVGENGKTSAHYNYDEFGRPLPSVKFDQNWPGPDITFGYTGYQYDVSAELWYAQARYYMPEIGRFISEDPWSGTMTIPTTMNPYPYVLNNPIKYVDPLGLLPAVDAEGKVKYNPYTKNYIYDSSAAEKAHKEILTNQSNTKNNPVNKANNKVQQNEIKNGSDAIYGNLGHVAGWVGSSAKHRAVQDYVKDVIFNDKAELEVSIKGASALGNTGYADIVYGKYIWEVKPDKSSHYNSGPKQLKRYVENMPGVPGYDLGVFVVPYGDKELVVRSGEGLAQQGMLYYSERNKKREQKQEVTQKSKEKDSFNIPVILPMLKEGVSMPKGLEPRLLGPIPPFFIIPENFQKILEELGTVPIS